MFDLIPFENENPLLWNPFAELERSFFGNLHQNLFLNIDIVDKGGHFEVRADLPGFAKEDIRLDINGACMTITAEQQKDTEETQKNYVRRERRYGSMCRSFDLTGIDSDNITAKYCDGVLLINLPKLPGAAPPCRRIELT